MTVSASIKFDQGATHGNVGEALFGDVGTVVVASNGNNAGVERWIWTILDSPPGSAVVPGIISDGSVTTLSFTPDRAGTYFVQLDAIDNAGNVATDYRCFAVKNNAGRYVPAFGAAFAALNFAGQKRGWALTMEDYLGAIDGKWKVGPKSRVYTFVAETSTPDATPAAVEFVMADFVVRGVQATDLELPAGPRVVRADALISVEEVAGGDFATFSLTALFGVDGGNVVTQVGATVNTSPIASGGAGTWASDLGTDGTLFIPTVTGQAARNLRWLTVLQLSARGA